METSQLIVLLSAILFCFICQTIILKTRISESLEETLRSSRPLVETLPEQTLNEVVGNIEKSGEILAESVRNIHSFNQDTSKKAHSVNVDITRLLDGQDQVSRNIKSLDTKIITRLQESEEKLNKKINLLNTKMTRLQESESVLSAKVGTLKTKVNRLGDNYESESVSRNTEHLDDKIVTRLQESEEKFNKKITLLDTKMTRLQESGSVLSAKVDTLKTKMNHLRDNYETFNKKLNFLLTLGSALFLGVFILIAVLAHRKT